MQQVDLAIVGAGPAGIAASVEAAALGLSVVLLDEQPRAGGQIYRDIERATKQKLEVLGRDYAAGQRLIDALTSSNVQHVPGASVWQVDQEGVVCFTVAGKGHSLSASRVLFATGAIERPVPIPGWTKPGVMMAGAGQILLKQSGIVAKRAVIAGSGPLLYLIAAQMVRAGTPPLALVETQTRRDILRAQRHFLGVLFGWRYLVKGLTLLAELRRAGVKRYQAATDLEIHGQDVVERLHFKRRGQSREIACDTVFLHMGVVPNVQLSRALGLHHEWNEAQHCFRPILNEWGGSSAKRIYIAGDGAGISGAKGAEIAGRVSALKIAADLGKLPDPDLLRRAKPFQDMLARERAIRPFLDVAYPPSGEVIAPPDQVVVCRCEEVTAGDIRRYAEMGCEGPNQTKAFGRPGMGPCQGRYCGLTVSSILATAHSRTEQETGYYRIRPPVKPLTVGELAEFQPTGDGEKEGLKLG